MAGIKTKNELEFFKNEDSLQQLNLVDVKESTGKWLIYPSLKYKQYWDILIMVLMIYTATVFPVLTCFVDDTT